MPCLLYSTGASLMLVLALSQLCFFFGLDVVELKDKPYQQAQNTAPKDPTPGPKSSTETEKSDKPRSKSSEKAKKQADTKIDS